ncbi:Flp family type IVb pilin [Mesorhizobium sp.]|uniref:Flp family type IVb pilin n=1 Tax=Mesorhizobium sp. TaxID=1871066 RepID=UPI000FE56114|nr:Flp family type IVb pilin [Mesorhizobium sp.]RWE74998.1 MAG: Flp family type IVb pilin [Mesorhizobium sp.]TIV31698.1 MAG: Flp family type IVb pilin [Mesorhizobium sp.]
MKKLMTMARQFRDDDNGAAMVEYTILLGLIAAATIATIVLVAAWVTGTWSALCTTLDTTAVGCG